MKAIITLISTLLFTLPISNSTASYSIEVGQSKLTVSGTSSLHPWKIELQEMNCNADIDVNENQVVFNGLTFEAKAESLKSEHGKMMDKKTYNALKSDDYPMIVYTLKEAKTVTITNGSFEDVLKGELYMAGFRKIIDLKISGSIENGLLSLNGEKSLLMTDFKMDPPTALMGTIKTGNEVVIHYAIKLKSK